MNVAKPRVRCRACGQRVSRGLSVCPFCGHDPVRFHTRWSATALSVLCGLLLGIVLASNVDGLRFAESHGYVEVERYLLDGDDIPFVTLRKIY